MEKMSVFHTEKRLTYTVLNVMVLVAIPAMNNGTNIQRGDTTALRYNYVCHMFLHAVNWQCIYKFHSATVQYSPISHMQYLALSRIVLEANK